MLHVGVIRKRRVIREDESGTVPPSIAEKRNKPSAGMRELLAADIELFLDRRKIMKETPYLRAFGAEFAAAVIDKSRRQEEEDRAFQQHSAFATVNFCAKLFVRRFQRFAI